MGCWTHNYSRIIRASCDWFVSLAISESNEFILYAVRNSIHRYDLATGMDQALPLTGLREAVALDFDYDRNCLYWADISLDNIQVWEASHCCAGLTVVALVCWVLCLDWSPVFFSQVVTLSVSSLLQRLCLNGSTGQEVVVKKDLQNVEALTFDPVSRLLYWVDAGAQKIEVQRSRTCLCFYSWLTLKKMKCTGTQDQERFWLIIKSWTQTDYSM